MTDGANCDGVIYHYRSLIHSSDAQDGNLRLIDDRRADQAAEAAEIGDGERSAHHFIGLQLARTGARCQIYDGTLQAEHVLLIRGANYGDDETVFESHRNADVDLVVIADVVVIERRIQQRELT